MRSVPIRLALLAVAAFAAIAAFAGAPAGACACGIAIEATVSEESGLVVEGDGSERIVLSLDLTSDGSERAAVVLPVPGQPTVAAIEHGDPIAYLEQATAPPPQVGATAGGGDGAAAPPVDVIGREQVGGYDVSRLAADDSQSLAGWLAENEYTIPDGAEPILSDYVDEGWKFVAIRLAPESDGVLKPLDVEFPTDEFVYPMKLAQLGAEPIDLTVFTLADGKRAIDGLGETYAGPVGELSPAPPEELAELFADGTYVTRLEATAAPPSQFTSDLEIVPADSSELTAADGGAATEAAEEAEDEDDISVLEIVLVIVVGLTLAGALLLVASTRHSDRADR